MNTLYRLSLAVKALRELGPRQLGLYALYKLGLKVGYFRWITDIEPDKKRPFYPAITDLYHLLDFPDRDEIINVIGKDGLLQLETEADEIVDGQVRLFGNGAVTLELSPQRKLVHWAQYEQGNKRTASQRPQGDIKYIWEPARFGWTFTLGRAYFLTADEHYPEAFWNYFEVFQNANPINMGPNWASGQEVAFRIMAFVFAAQMFAGSPHSTEKRKNWLVKSLAEHANRIPPTLIYALAQNNNHLLSEACGLITASLALPDHPKAAKWLKLGWKWFNLGIETQIDNDGAYVQHSTNYHRLMLQLAMWVSCISSQKSGLQNDKALRKQKNKGKFSRQGVFKLARATQWLLMLTDKYTGRVPNLGPNDGAYIFPLTLLPFQDYRPVLQAASTAFLGEPAFETGPWDEMDLWFSKDTSPAFNRQFSLQVDHPIIKKTPLILDNPGSNSWGYLRAAHFSGRPGHADQLHADLWWRGFNIAQDPGTYRYNAAAPWDNALANTTVHNTVIVDGIEQMTRVGRFLYVDRAQAMGITKDQPADRSWTEIKAHHDGYLRFGIIHTRSLTAHQNGCWVVEDLIQPAKVVAGKAIHEARLHWLLPDWDVEWLDSDFSLRIKSPHGWVSIKVSVLEKNQNSITKIQPIVVRAGKLIKGSGTISPTWGWVAPTYGVKVPAVSFAVTLEGELPMTISSEWVFPAG